mgnify:CR=1 FL=1
MRLGNNIYFKKKRKIIAIDDIQQEIVWMFFYVNGDVLKPLPKFSKGPVIRKKKGRAITCTYRHKCILPMYR